MAGGPVGRTRGCSVAGCGEASWQMPGDGRGLHYAGVPLPPLCLGHSDAFMAKLAVEEIREGGDGLDGYRRWREAAGLGPMELTDRLAEIPW